MVFVNHCLIDKNMTFTGNTISVTGKGLASITLENGYGLASTVATYTDGITSEILSFASYTYGITS